MEGSTGDEKATTGNEASYDLGEDGVYIFDAMSFVDNNVLKREFLEGRFFDKADFIGGDTDFEILRKEAVRDNLGTLFPRASEKNDIEIWRPLLEFSGPVL